MTDAQIVAVEHIAVTPAQRLVAVHAARARTIRELTLTTSTWPVGASPSPVTPNGSRSSCTTRWSPGCSIAGARGRTRRTGTSWSPRVTATGTAPVSDYYLSWHLLLRGVQLKQIRGDRVLHEALAVGADPLHLAAVFHLSSSTAIAYADIARILLEGPVAATPVPPAPSPLDH